MNNDFVARHKEDWEELESRMAAARRSPRKLTPADWSRLDVLYRRTTVHLAQVTSRTTDVALARYLNDLAASAHALIYLPARQSLFRGAARFLIEGFSQSVARTWRFHVASLLLVLSGVLVAYLLCHHDPMAAYALLPAGEIRLPGSSAEQLQAVLRSGRDHGGGFKFIFASFLFQHNLKVSVLAMGLGVLAGIPTVLLLLYNGMLLGAFAAIHVRAGITTEFWAWILPHGVTEILAIVLFGGVGLLMGAAVLRPGLLPRAESLKEAGIEAGRIIVGGGLMLVFAAIIESYLRQSHLPTAPRLLFAGGTAAFWFFYFLCGFLGRPGAIAKTRGSRQMRFRLRSSTNSRINGTVSSAGSTSST